MENNSITRAELWNTQRLESFTDGVLAVIITFLAFEIKLPHGTSWGDLGVKLPELFIYLITFTTVGIHWNQHHQLFRAAERIDGYVMWTNLNWLFWLSLFPVITGWIGPNLFETVPAVVFGIILNCAGFSMFIQSKALLRANRDNVPFAAAVRGTGFKGAVAGTVGLVGIIAACFLPLLGYIIYALVGSMWFVPDTRFTKIAN